MVQVLDFPTNDPNFDPDNLKYSCIRYVPSSTQNAMGPSWVDPMTGEILNASILVYNDIVKMLNYWAFCADGTNRSPGEKQEVAERCVGGNDGLRAGSRDGALLGIDA